MWPMTGPFSRARMWHPLGPATRRENDAKLLLLNIYRTKLYHSIGMFLMARCSQCLTHSLCVVV